MSTFEFVLLSLILILQVLNLYLSRNKSSLPAAREEEQKPPQTLVPAHQFHPHFNPEDHQILEFRDGEWKHHSWRHANHPDIQIYSNHKRFNVRQPDGHLMREEAQK